MKTPFFFLFFLIYSHAFSQGEIHGKILDSISHSPVPYAVISIYQNGDPKPIAGKLSDSSGTFSLTNLPPSTYDVKIEFLGYHTRSNTHLALKKDQSLDLGNFLLAPSVLHEVTVSSQQQTLTSKIDRQVYKADQFQNAKGGTAIDVLKNTSSVTINAEGDIRLRGNNGFLLLLNGKPVATDANTLLQQIPANSIDNIEIITTPSARYDADGKSGIINITTKKGSADGWSYTINGQYGLPSVNSYHNLAKPLRYGGDALINYRQNAWEFNGGFSYLQNDLAGQREGAVNTTLGNRYSSFSSIGERSFIRKNYSLRAALSFSPSPENSFTVSAYHGQRLQIRRADIYYTNYKTDILTGNRLGYIYYFNSNIQKKQGNFSLANAEYTHTFKNKSALTFSGLYEYAVLDGFTKNLNADPADHKDTLDYVLNTANSPLSGIRGKADYVLPIGKGKFESGYQFRYQEQTGTFLYNHLLPGTSEYIVLPEFSADISVVNTIHSLYTQYSRTADKFQYVAGLRYEYASRIFKANKQPEAYVLNLSNLFPSLSILYNLRPQLKLKAGYSKRVQRSNSNELNPYPEREHSETLEQGDAHILPEFVDVTELGINHEVRNISYFITVYNQHIQHVVNRVNSAYNDTIINRIYTNAGNAELWGTEAGLTFSPVNWWKSYTGGNIYHYSIKGSLFNNEVSVKNQGVAYTLTVNESFQLNKTISAQLSLNYLSLRPTAIGEDSRFISPNFSIKKNFLKNSLSVMLSWQNVDLGLLHSNEQRITTWGENFYTTTNYIQEKDVFWINISYQFRQLSKKAKLPASEFGEKEF